jgi:hypothetical protein
VQPLLQDPFFVVPLVFGLVLISKAVIDAAKRRLQRR